MEKILFVSLYNVRNQMAAAFLKQLAGHKFEVYSAWVLSDEFSLLVVDAMKEIGVDVLQNKAKRISELNEIDCFFDYTVTLYEDSNLDKCPLILKTKKRIYWEIESPLSVVPEEKSQKVRRIRDKIRSRVEHWLKDLSPTA